MNRPADENTKLEALRGRVTAAGGPDAGELEQAIDELQALRLRSDAATKLQTGQAAIMALVRSKALDSGELEQALAEISEVSALLFQVDRVSVWLYSDDLSSLACIEQFLVPAGSHSSGMSRTRAELPHYFESLDQAMTITANDVHADHRAAELSASYFRAHDIGAILDVPIHVGERMIGVVCNEHVGGTRTWTTTEQWLASALADVVALAIESNQRRRSEASLRALVTVAEERLQTIERQREAIAELTSPIIDVWRGVLAVTIIGAFDSGRSLDLTQRLLERIASSNTKAVLIDLTGVDLVDTMTASNLMQMIKAVGLLGTRSIVSGISPQIAQTLAHFDLDLDDITTVRTLAEGLRLCIASAQDLG